MPSLGPAHERLARLAGRWSGEEMVAPSAWASGGSATARQHFTVAVGGFVVLQDYCAATDGGDPLTAHGVLSVDSASGDVVHHWFDSRGFTVLEPARGGWEGDSLALVRSSERGVNRTTLTVDSDGLLHSVEFRAPGDERFGVVASGRYRREE